MNDRDENDQATSKRGRVGQSGQVLILLLIFLLPMTMATMSVYNVGTVVADKMALQNAADNAAYSAATWEARYMNQMAYINRAMVANYDTIATLVGLWSMIDSVDGLLGLVELVATVLFGYGDDIVRIIHEPVGQVNKFVGTNIVGGNSSIRVARAIELYTLTLSYLQEVLYVAYQAGRSPLIQSIAWGVDEGAQYWLPAEGYNVYSLESRRKWAGTDKDSGLRRTVERSLNDFSNGGSLRDGLFAVMPQFIRDIKSFINSIPCPVPGGAWDISIGIQGFDGYPFNRVSGKVAGVFGTEHLFEAGSYAGHDIVEDTMISQVDFTGVKLSLCVLSLGLGHHSHDDWNLGGTKGGAAILFTPHIMDASNNATSHHYDNFSANDINCIPIGGGLGDAVDSDTQELNQGIKECTEGTSKSSDPKGKHYVAYQDGKPTFCTKFDPFSGCTDGKGNKIPGQVRSCDQLGDIFKDLQANQGEQGIIPCQTSYLFGTPLQKVRVTTFVSDDSISKTGIAQGPNNLVYLRMKREALGLFSGLGVGPEEDDYNLQTYAFSKAYYTTRVPPNWLSMKLWAWKEGWRTTIKKNDSLKISGNETMFNPFWAGKLELPSLGTLQIKKGGEAKGGASIDPLLH